MTISLGDALHSIKEDESWKKKVFIGGLVCFVILAMSVISEMKTTSTALFFTAFVLYIIASIFNSGFLISTGNKQINSSSNQMAEWSEPNLLVKGLKFFVCSIVAFIIFFILCGIAVFIIGLAFALIVGIAYWLLSLIFGQGNPILNLLSGLLGICLGIIIGLYVSQFLFTIITSYMKNLRFADMMAFKKHFVIIKENHHAVWTLLGKNILYTLLFALICIILCLTCIGVIAVPFVIFIAGLVNINLLVQYGRHIEIGRYFD